MRNYSLCDINYVIYVGKYIYKIIIFFPYTIRIIIN